MTFILGYLPDGIGESDIRKLFLSFSRITKVIFLNNRQGMHSCYECMVEIDLSDKIVGSILAKKINNQMWRNSRISARMLIF